jgi:hypothetical protein
VAPGTKWSYANHGFVVLGQLIEDLSGQPLGDYMRARLFEPLGMASTSYGRTDRSDQRMAKGYHQPFGRVREGKDYDLTVLGAGAVLSSLADLARYASWLLSARTAAHDSVLSPTTLTEMHTQQYAIDRRLPGIGLAFSLNRLGPHDTVGHDGNIPGFASALVAVPEAGLAVVVLTNVATLSGANLLAASVARAVLGLPDPVEVFAATPASQPSDGWGQLVGYYAPQPGFLTNLRTWAIIGGEVEIAVRGGHLTLRAHSPFRRLRRGLPLKATDVDDPWRFAFQLDGLIVPVLFDGGPQGRVDRLILGRPVSAVLTRRSTPRSSRVRLRLAGLAGLVGLATESVLVIRRLSRRGWRATRPGPGGDRRSRIGEK